jgi:pimeloyl-ACP methyl ester carboxylesterase
MIAVDQRGHGDSERAGSYLVRDYAADVVELLREEFREPVVILGHSLGAMVAACAAGEAPDWVRGIVLLDPPFHTMGNRMRGSTWEALFLGIREAAREGKTMADRERFLSAVQIPQADGRMARLGDLRDAASIRWSAECLSRMDPEVLTPVVEGRWLEALDVMEIAGRIRCLSVVVQADPSAGGALSDEEAQPFCGSLSEGRWERLSGVGHLVHHSRPERVAGWLNAAFSG